MPLFAKDASNAAGCADIFIMPKTNNPTIEMRVSFCMKLFWL
jgi:hypothetical protein